MISKPLAKAVLRLGGLMPFLGSPVISERLKASNIAPINNGVLELSKRGSAADTCPLATPVSLKQKLI